MTELIRYRIPVEEYDRMIECGILTEDHALELIHGELVEKMPIGDRHAHCVDASAQEFGAKCGSLAWISIQNPVRLRDSKPEPDINLLRPPGSQYRTTTPRPQDVLLLVEVSDKTLEKDREIKGPLYAQNNIGEYWIVNLIDDCVEVYRQPQPDGSYAEKFVRRRGEMLDIAALPGVTIKVDDIL